MSRETIPPLPPVYVDHLVNPRNTGDVDEAHAAGEAGSMVGGLGARITLRYGTAAGRPVITEARGRAFGSPAPIPALSWLTETLVGRSMEEALALDPEDVTAGITGGNGFEPPERTTLAAEYALCALRAALGHPDASPPADPGGPGILVCRCLGVGDRTIRRAIRSGACDPEAVGDACRASTGCRSCRPDVLMLIDEELRPPPPVPSADRHPVAQIALVHAGRQLRGLGMPLEDAAVEDPVVTIRLGAAALGATVSPVGAVAITRHVLRELVWDGIRVELAG